MLSAEGLRPQEHLAGLTPAACEGLHVQTLRTPSEEVWTLAVDTVLVPHQSSPTGSLDPPPSDLLHREEVTSDLSGCPALPWRTVEEVLPRDWLMRSQWKHLLDAALEPVSTARRSKVPRDLSSLTSDLTREHLSPLTRFHHEQGEHWCSPVSLKPLVPVGVRGALGPVV